MRSKRIVAAIGAMATVVSGAVVGAAAGGGVAAAAPACPRVHVIAIPGTWETSAKPKRKPSPGMLAGVTRGLPSDYRVDYVQYAATAFPWEGEVYGKSRREAVDGARGLIQATAQRCAATKFAIVGYSQGADAAGDVAAEIGTGLGVVPPHRVSAVGLLSDPSRSPQDVQVGPHVDGAGAAGPRPGGFGLVTPVTRTICAIGDLYCSTASSDFATRFAGFLAGVSEMNPAKLWSYQQQFGAIMADLMNGGGIGLLQSQFTDQANAKRAKQLQRFYNSNVHNDYASYHVSAGQTAPQWLHNYLLQAGH
ncbi:MAG: cutinase family protein [Mycobacteriaceae bacterium]|nr:cutinase family protein [Mycobacteriaceae bacterium]